MTLTEAAQAYRKACAEHEAISTQLRLMSEAKTALQYEEIRSSDRLHAAGKALLQAAKQFIEPGP